MRRYYASRIFTGSQIVEPGTLVVDGDRVAAIEVGGPSTGDICLGDVTLTPGLVDVHCHGGGGAEFAEDASVPLSMHRACGTTTSIASLVTQGLDELAEQVRRLAEYVRRGELAGIHLEGPWLAPGKRGAHPEERLRTPTRADVMKLLDTGAGAISMVTLAPELPEALDAIQVCVARGVVASIGHTDADFATTQAAVEAGATGATHLFNQMPPLHHRDPGPVLALAADNRVWLELIADGTHVHTAMIAATMRQFPDRAVLITDAMAAAGSGDGNYRLGELEVIVDGGIARTHDGKLAGSTLTLADAVRLVIKAGIPWQQALRAATALPAQYVGIADVGTLAPGTWADVVAFDPLWRVQGVLRHGAWI